MYCEQNLKKIQPELIKKNIKNGKKNPNLYELLSLSEGEKEINSLSWDLKSKSISKNLLKMVNQKYEIETKDPIYPLKYNFNKNNSEDFLINSSDIETNSPVFSVIIETQNKIKKENKFFFNKIQEKENNINNYKNDSSKNSNKNNSSKNINSSMFNMKNNFNYNKNNLQGNNSVSDFNESIEFDIEKLNCNNLNSQFSLKNNNFFIKDKDNTRNNKNYPKI
jgi:hypothetical protein